MVDNSFVDACVFISISLGLVFVLMVVVVVAVGTVLEVVVDPVEAVVEVEDSSFFTTG